MSELVKITCLVVLVVQTVSNVLIIRNARHYNVSVPFIVVLQEVLKLFTCVGVLGYKYVYVGNDSLLTKAGTLLSVNCAA